MVENNVMQIDDVEIPWGLLFLNYINRTPPAPGGIPLLQNQS